MYNALVKEILRFCNVSLSRNTPPALTRFPPLRKGREHIVLIFTLFLLIFITGCARVVTDKSLGGVTLAEARFTFTFDNSHPLAQNANQYYYLIISTANLTLPANNIHPYPVGTPGKHFATPENAYLALSEAEGQGIRNDYYVLNSSPANINLDTIYDGYFNKWTAYYSYNGWQQLLYEGPFVSTNLESVPINRPPVSVEGKTLVWKINLPPNCRDFHFALVAVQDTIVYTDSIIEQDRVGVNSPSRHLSRPGLPNSVIKAYTVDIVEY